MQLYEFILLELEEQQDMALVEGDFVDVRFQGGYRILLYQVYGFYVEIFYEAEKHRIVKHRSFSSLTQLEPYLRTISLEGLT